VSGLGNVEEVFGRISKILGSLWLS
jgi:hypothetical protein